TIRLLIAMASNHNLIIHQMDVKTAFLNGELDDDVYMNQPQGFIMPGNENKADLTKEFLSLRFSMKDMREGDVILGIRIKHEINRIEISQSYYIEKVLKKFSFFDCTPGDWLLDVCHDLYKLLLLCSKVTLLQAGLATLKTIRLPVDSCCDATLAKAYSQMYNGKSRHLGVRHSMIRELIT
ncbi:zinc finger, CCHC-type containing protein, partial [Tanacetum coccineum]